ncbi:MAG: hypothetical protein R2698_10915 [Microthrixaceae bacterium]
MTGVTVALAFVPLGAVAASWRPIPVTLFVAGVAVALLRGDLSEHYMLGDAGSNALGAAIGLGLLVTTSGSPTMAWCCVAVLALLNVASEVVSFSKVIDSVSLLRRFDRWGSPFR